jgi:hypothetical protein
MTREYLDSKNHSMKEEHEWSRYKSRTGKTARMAKVRVNY